MVDILTNPPRGWNNWVYLSSTFGTAGGEMHLPDAPFPSIYTPSSSFMMRSLIDHCLIPWINVVDPYVAFALAGGTSSLSGAIGGLAAMNDLNNLSNATGTFSIFPRGKGGYGPRLGYCIGTFFKQQIYVRFDVMNGGGGVVFLGACTELVENSRFKRLYFYEGEIANYYIEGDEHLLKLDIDNNALPNIVSAEGTITIIKRNGTEFSLSINGIKSNWDLIIGEPAEGSSPEAGDYYKIDQPWVIEDPSLLSGFLKGTENELFGSVTSGFNLFVSDKNIPYEEGKFLGTYLWEPQTVLADNIEAVENTNVADVEYFQPSANSSMGDSAGYTWGFLGYGNSAFSETYSNDTRYKDSTAVELTPEVSTSEGTSPEGVPVTIFTHPERAKADTALYQKAISNPNIDYLRVEISGGGYFYRNNFHAPALKGSYIVVNGAKFKIMGHVSADIIDVSIKSIDGSTSFDPSSNQSYSIFNQYAWMINENYIQSSLLSSIKGLYEGRVVSISDKTVKVAVEADSYILTGEKDGYSLNGRYKNGVTIPNTTKTKFNRFKNWRLVANKTEYVIDSGASTPVKFGEIISTENMEYYDIDIVLLDIPNELNVGDTAYIVFDSMYKTASSNNKGLGITLNVTASSGSGGDTGFVTSSVLCLDGEFLSIPYLIHIPINTRFGICDGAYFGISSNGSASRIGAQTSYITTQSSTRGVASLFHNLRQEDWVCYMDSFSDNLTIRKGSANFSEYPSKNLMIIGSYDSIETSGGGSKIVLNQDKEYLSRIQMTVPQAGKNASGPQQLDENANLPALMFGIGGPNNIYGFAVSGDGVVNLGVLNRDGDNTSTLEDGSVPSNTWTNQGIDVSPVYIYKQTYYSQTSVKQVDIGVETGEGPIYINGGAVSDVSLQYVKKNQLLGVVGFFDIIRRQDGYIMLIYGDSVNNFTAAGNLNNSTNGVFIIGTSQDGYTWLSPDVEDSVVKDEEKQYTLMVLNGVEFLSSIYNFISEKIVIFCKCRQNGTSYIGCFIIPAYNLLSNAILSTPVDENERPFLWRPPFISSSIINNPDESWVDSENIIKTDFDFDEAEGKIFKDTFVRVFGPESTNSQVESLTEFGIISTSMLPDGTYVLLYNEEGGIKSLFSSDQGQTWHKSNIFWARNASSPVLINQYLLYITNSGIEALRTSYTYFYAARDLSEGILDVDGEKELEASLASLSKILIGSGAIDPQRLSGYINSEGVLKVFFYEQNQYLKCMESTDRCFSWTVANNF